jgi:hypothetical protein
MQGQSAKSAADLVREESSVRRSSDLDEEEHTNIL